MSSTQTIFKGNRLMFTRIINTLKLNCRFNSTKKMGPVDHGAEFASDKLEGWLVPQSQNHNCLRAKRPFNGCYDNYAKIVDDALANRFEDLRVNVQFPAAPRGRSISVQDMEAVLNEPLDGMCKKAALPDDITQQIRSDAIHLSTTVSALCPTATKFTIRLQIFGENCCSRFHQDQYVGRGIVSYTGNIGTEFVDDKHVDFWELENCGNNTCVVKDKHNIHHAEVGDFLFIKGTMFPYGSKGLVHKAPEKVYHPDGRIVNRLVLKV